MVAEDNKFDCVLFMMVMMIYFDVMYRLCIHILMLCIDYKLYQLHICLLTNV